MSDLETREKYARYITTSFTTIEPVVVHSGEGARITDASGQEFIDCFAGISVVNAGHGHPTVREAAKAQIDRLTHAGSYTYYVEPVADFAEALAEVAPGRLQKTFFSNSGAEGIEAALRLAKVYTGKREIIALERSFHGRSYGTLSITGNMTRKTRGGPYAGGVAFAPAPYTYRSLYGDDPEVVAEKCAQALEETIRFHTSGDVAAFIIEPVMGEGGLIVPPVSYMTRVKEILDRYDILLIADEVQSGFGRTGKLFAIEHFGVEPDIMVMAKGIADGFPLAATIARAEIADSFHIGEHLSTFGGNPVSCAAGLANLRVMQQEDLPGQAARKGETAMATLRGWQEKLPAIGEVRGLGLMVGIELVSDRTTRAPTAALAKAVRAYCREHGVLVGVGGSEGNVVRVQPPLVISDDDLAHALDVVAAGIGAHASVAAGA
ncbi:MAG TPA: aspartate aminotransferase family protein [Ktedonobacterales bacterium]|nr:aspartate aminotransferase family protein [Ktedonobacterales bacterium]